MACSFLDQAMLLDCLPSTLGLGDSSQHAAISNNMDQVADQGVETTILTASTTSTNSPQSPVSAMADLTFLLVDKNNSYKEVIDYYYSPSQQQQQQQCHDNNHHHYKDPYDRDRLRQRRRCDEEEQKLRALGLDSIFDKHMDTLAAHPDLDMEWSDDDADDDAEEEPRGLVFLLDDCSMSTGSVTGMDCSAMGWNSFSSAFCQDDEESSAANEHSDAPPTAQ